MTDFEWEVIEDMYTWAEATSFDIEADRKMMIDAYWKDYFIEHVRAHRSLVA